MKRCIKSQDAPQCLSDFKQNNPTGTWDQFRDQNNKYLEVRDSLYRDQGGLCAYCELKLIPDNQQVAHFHPKSDKSSTHNWALDWTNLWLACKGGSQNWMTDVSCYLPPLPENLSCDECKGNKILDDAVLAPSEVLAFPNIFRYEQHLNRLEIHVNKDACERSGVDIVKAQATIDKFNLNCQRLAAARLSLHRQLENAIKKLRESGRDPEDGFMRLAQKHLTKDVNESWPQFFSLVRWRFRNTAESYLQACGYIG